MPRSAQKRVAVVGGGITGLAAAWFLRDRADVTLFEASDRLGGKICTDDFAGRRVEAGPDAFLARVPDAADLCREVGLGDELVSPAARHAFVWARDALRRIPEGTILGAPTKLGPLARSGSLSRRGIARAALARFVPPPRTDSVGELVARRFGEEVERHLVDPLVGGIHGGPARRLSVRAVAPQLAERHLSVPAPSDDPVFFTVRSGLDRLVARLATAVPDLRCSTPIEKIEPGWHVNGERFDAVIATTPSYVAREMLPIDVPPVDYASVVLVLMSYPAIPLDGSGFVVARDSGLLMTACSWASSKWAHLAGDPMVLRVSAGRWDEPGALELDDGTLVERLQEEVARTVGVSSAPMDWRVVRWPQSFPQQTVGHLDRVAALERSLPPGLALAGAAYRGLGIPACIAQARMAARRVVPA